MVCSAPAAGVCGEVCPFHQSHRKQPASISIRPVSSRTSNATSRKARQSAKEDRCRRSCSSCRLHGLRRLHESDHSLFPSSNHISISPISSPCHFPSNSFPSIRFLRFALTLTPTFCADGVPFGFSLSCLGLLGS